MWDFPLFPDTASTVAPEVDELYFSLIGLSIVFILTIGGAALYFLARYRHTSDADRTQPPAASWKLEGLFIGTSLIVASTFFFWGAYKYLKISQIPDDAMELFVLGKQWMWKVQYPQGQREINKLYVPVDRPILLRMTSRDVIHSFYIPDFRIKQDVVPGRYTTMWFEATKVGTFKLECAEYCGTDHSRMRGEVIVLSQADYAEWLAGQSTDDSPVSEGEEVYTRAGCSGCHDQDSAVHAPDLTGLFGRTVHLSSGEKITADESYIRDSILLPNKQIVAGYEPIMPSFEGQLGEQEIFALVEFIKSTGDAPEQDSPAPKAPESGEKPDTDPDPPDRSGPDEADK